MKRVWLSRALVGLGAATAVLALRRRIGPRWLTVLTYHRVAARPDLRPMDPDVVEVGADVFERHLATLQSEFDFVGLDDVMGFARGGAMPRMPLMLTFDDGYRDNHDVVLPALIRHGARATFFVATTYLDEQRLFWWDRLHRAVALSQRAQLEIAYPLAHTLALGDAPRRAAAVRALLTLVKTVVGMDVNRFVAHVEECAGVPLSRDEERALADRHLLTWDQVRAMRAAGMDIGSHTRTHRVMQMLPTHELDDELAGSRARLEEELREPVRALAYPVGRAEKTSAALRAAVRRAGYAIAFSNRGGVNHAQAFDAFDLRRIGLDALGSEAHFRAVLAVPSLAY